MKKYTVSISKDAFDDIQDLYYSIVLEYQSPLTAKRYVDGLYAELKSLENTAETFALREEHSLLKYGAFVRRVNYKKMTIIYTVHDDIAYVHRIIASSLITDL